MPRLHTCPNGHHWPAADDGPSSPGDPALVCPTCGTFADTPAALEQLPASSYSEEKRERGLSSTNPHAVARARANVAVEAYLPAIEGYEILGEIGRGGMGIVYKARDLTHERLVAIKVIRKDRLTHAESIRRFRREADAAARLAHPNIVRVHDSDHNGDLHYLVMDFVDGVTLQRLLDQHGRLPVADVCEFARQTALGLQHLHEQALVHRDIKPANLMLTHPGGAGRQLRIVKILDMGVARLYQLGDSPVETLTTLTQDGAVIGTADFIAPEQLERPHEADIRADLYSLGCTLYALLTGQVPFPGGTLFQKLDRQRSETPPAVDQLRPEIGAGVVAVVRRLMAKQPAERYRTPAELAVALGQLTGDLPAAAAAVPPLRETRRLEGHSAGILAVAFAPDGKRLLSGGLDKTLRLWDAATGALLREFAGSWQEIRAVAMLADGKSTLAASGASLRLIDLESGKELARFTGHTDTIRAVAVSRCGTRAATGADDRTVRIWDVQAGREMLRYTGHGAAVTGLAFSADGDCVLSGGRDQSLRWWSAAYGKDILRFAVPRGAVLGVALSPDGRLAASAHFDTSVRLWEIASGKELRRFHGHKQMATTAVFLPDHQRVLTGAQDQTLRLWDEASGCELARFDGHTGGVGCVALAPNGETAASASLDKTVRLWRLPK